MAKEETIKRTYKNIKGVDFSREARNVSDNRSPMMVNMWKDYLDDSHCVVTREGYKLIADFSSLIDNALNKRIYGIHVYTNLSDNLALVHIGKFLYLYKEFPSQINLENTVLLSDKMNECKSMSFMYNEKLYINDGLTYYRFDGENLIEVGNKERINEQVLRIDSEHLESSFDIPFIPTTSISRLPDGGGESYQGVNVLTGFRKNSFSGDNKTKVYALDTTDLTNNDIKYLKVWINDTYIDLKNGTSLTYDVKDSESGEVTTKTDTFKLEENGIDTKKGTITFNVAPPMADTLGQDNVVIMFYKDVDGYADRINNCKINAVFDNRVFFSGSKTYKNGLFYSELNDPEYISDLNYYQDGSDNENITSITVAGNVLWVFKESKEGGNNLFYHKPDTEQITITNTQGKSETKYYKTYPVKQGKSSFGSFGCSINFKDDVCFLTKEGMYGLKYSDLNSDIYASDFVCERSSLVNPKMTNEDKYLDASMDIYKGYLCILINGNMYLADSRKTFEVNKGYEYEWFYFEGLRVFDEQRNEYKGIYLKSFDNKLYFATDGGHICVFDETLYKDNEENMENYILLKSDNFSDINHLKTTSKRGGIAKFKVMGNSSVGIYIRTNKSKEYKYITTYKNAGFSFIDLDFRTVSFLLDQDNNYGVIKTKQKKFNELQIKLKGETIDKKESRPFGFFSFTLEGYKGNYIKR